MGGQYRLWAGGGLVCVRVGGCLFRGGGGGLGGGGLGWGGILSYFVLHIINI